ncbi:alpha/beta fold hydrolase [Streptomyces sp. DT24]|uniref:alpha/beta fold hydrolase n=1 Tax=unclassified Streptomyces TaxID=2593676 RepID=UPI003CEE80C6
MNHPDAAHRALRLRTSPATPRTAALLLHGGTSESLAPPSALNLPGVRMWPFGRAILRAAPTGDVLLGTVRYRHRGWNGERTDPLHDAHDALDALTALTPPVPTVLVGHSMGGRAALRAAEHPYVTGVVALAPWCPPGEPVAHLRGKHVIILHDPRDRVTSADESWDFLHRAEQAGALTQAVPMPRGGHTMLRDGNSWHRLTAALTLGLLAEPSRLA